MTDLDPLTGILPQLDMPTMQVINIVSFAACLFMNWFASILTGNTLTDIAAKNVLAIRPAGYTFAIWGLIYSLLLVFTIY